MSHKTFRASDRNEEMLEYLQDHLGYTTKTAAIQNAIALMYVFHKHQRDFYDAVLKVAEEKDMVELKAPNKYKRNERKSENS